jgi:hypothetical protein
VQGPDAGLIDESERGGEDDQALSRRLAQPLGRDLVQDEQAELRSLIGPGTLRLRPGEGERGRGPSGGVGYCAAKAQRRLRLRPARSRVRSKTLTGRFQALQ